MYVCILYVCVCVCMYACMCVCMYVCMVCNNVIYTYYRDFKPSGGRVGLGVLTTESEW